MAKQYNRKDGFYRQAKEQGYRSRASFKLLELNDKYKFLRPGAQVLDLGAWPGGWTQVASEKVGGQGCVVGVDLVELDPFSNQNVILLQGDLRDEETQARIREHGVSGFQVVLSDMSAKITGIKDADQAQALQCLETCFSLAQEFLQKSGTLVAKTFPGNDIDLFMKEMRSSFQKLNRIALKSSRGSSKEFYVVGTGFKGA